ncbi:MAG: hypothetical protein KC994_17840, partial [Candidatus Omnitrophica bacterium]|nr:hypothetical protein [Candidatus Omnitrophota bacterium]
MRRPFDPPIFVVVVEQRLAEHVRTGDRELEGVSRNSPDTIASGGKVEVSMTDCLLHKTGNTDAVSSSLLGAVRLSLFERGIGSDTGQSVRKIFDHPIGFGMVGVETVEFAIADDIDTGLFL